MRKLLQLLGVFFMCAASMAAQSTVVVSTVTVKGAILVITGTVDGKAVTTNLPAALVDSQKTDAAKLQAEAQALKRRANFKPPPPAPPKTYPKGTVTLPK